MKYVYLFLFAVLTLVSCSSDEIAPEGTNTNIPQGNAGYRFSVNVGEPTTRVTYHDNIGGNPYNPNSDGSNKLTMSWRNGDELVAIRWKAPYNEYVVLKAKVAEGQDVHSITFDAEDVTHFNKALEEGERFVLVHGDFVLDASDQADPKLAFPTSQVTKAGYGKNIHHGGVVGSDGAITFRNQDGTLENLRKHEYMVADCYVHKGEADASDNVPVSLSGDKDVAGKNVTMHIAHTLLRLTLFLPDEDFSDGGFDDDLISVSLKDVDMNNIFHRYFRMHPNKKVTTNYYETSYNNNADKEENPYIRINLADEEENKHGVSHTAINVFGSPTFNPQKPVVVKGELSGKAGHYFTLYFSLPSRHMGVDGQNVSELQVTAFTRTKAYTTKNTYRLPDDAMQPGKVVPLNVSFVNVKPIKAITDPELGFSFTPGFVYANKENGNWKLGVYENQGQYAGMINQTLDFGEYFTFGSTVPTDAAHRAGGVEYSANVPTQFVDVATEVEVGGVKGLYHMITKAEADRIIKRLQDEVKANGVFLGYYYYDADDKHGNTAHQAPGSHNDKILTAAAAGGAKTVDQLKAMSASVGIYVGRSTQPKFEEQDDFFFLPSAAQMSYGISGNNIKLIETGGTGSGVFYYLPEEESKYLDATGTGLTSAFTGTFKFSTWLRDVGNTGYRMQVWTTNTGKALDTGRTNNDKMDKTYARPIRAVIY